MQAWIPVVSSRLYFWKSVFSFQVDSILKWRVYIKLNVSWLRAFLWCMSQTSRDRVNSRCVLTHEKNSGDAVRRLGTIIQSIFCAQSGASIRLTVWKWSGESRYPGAFPPVLKTFRRAFFPGPTDRPWVSEDVKGQSTMINFKNHNVFASRTCLRVYVSHLSMGWRAGSVPDFSVFTTEISVSGLKILSKLW